MNFRSVTREEWVGPYAELWNLEYPDDKRSPAEIAELRAEWRVAKILEGDNIIANLKDNRAASK